ncbi:MAG: hypothetical protein ACYCXK_00100 [Candidatus Humimicrobiaceae bacterium]
MPKWNQIQLQILGWSNLNSIRKNAEVVGEKVHDLLSAIKFTRSLSEIGIKKGHLPKIIERVHGNEDLANDPGSYGTKEEIENFMLKII